MSSNRTSPPRRAERSAVERSPGADTPQRLASPDSGAPARREAASALLSRRLRALAAAVPAGARRLADIGYDRGHLLAGLLTDRADLEIVGVEIQPRAAARLHVTHPDLPGADRLRLVTGDALAALAPGAVEGVVIAGVAGRTIVEMLQRAPAVVASLEWLVLCPTRFNGVLRPGLASLGLYCADEVLVSDRGRTYEIIVARHGVEPCDEPAARRYGPRLFERRDPALLPYLEWVRRHFAHAFAHDLASYGPHMSPEAAVLGEKLRLLDRALALAAAPRA